VGHEIIGKVIAVGDKVTTCKVGDRVGVGAQVQSCMKCKNCLSDNENYCPHMVGAYLNLLSLSTGSDYFKILTMLLTTSTKATPTSP
jgi:D-arabinose 1-dehydrogenase-like Zn-dependent alcohol dehydrogenase